MVDSAPQWREAQRRKGEIIQRAVVSNVFIISFNKLITIIQKYTHMRLFHIPL